MKRRDFIKSSLATAAAVSYPSLVLASSQATVYFNGNILTMNNANSIVEAIAVKDDKIIGVGTKEVVLKFAGEKPKMVDLKGKTLLPGFVDGHSHFPSGAIAELNRVNLNVPPLGEVKEIADLVTLLKKRAATTPEGEWILGYNYNDLSMKEQRHPTLQELNSVSTKHPIMISHVSGHLAVVNQLAYDLAKITKDTKAPDGGNFRKDKSGELDGVLEGPPAQAIVRVLQPALSADTLYEAIKHDNYVYSKVGVTTAQNGGSPTMDPLVQKASSAGDLKIRLVIWPAGRNADLLKSYGDKRSGELLNENGKIIMGAAKLFADGSPQGYTAYFSKPYFKQMTGKEESFRGFPVFANTEELQTLVKSLHNDGWQIACHTNGDQAIQDLIDAYRVAQEENPRKDTRHILNHCQFTRPDQVVQIAELNLVPSYFVTHTYFWGDIHREFVAGPEMAAHISPLKSSLDAGIVFALHNDTPVTPISPLMDVFSAVNRTTLTDFVLGPDQRIGVMDALRGVTINAAYMHFMEDKVGSLEIGKLADLVILNENPLTIAPEKIKDIEVLETIVSGETIYKA